MKHTVVCLLAAAAALAGCAEQSEPEPDSQTGPPPPPLQGWVVDNAAQPLPDVHIEVQQTGANVTTDAAGHYSFNDTADVPADEPLVLVARAPAFLIASKQVVLVNETPVQVNFTLEPVPVKVPRVEQIAIEGFLACRGATTVAGQVFPIECGGGEQDSWDVAAAPDLAGVVIEVGWEPGSGLAERLHVQVETLSLGDLNQVLDEVTGESVLRLEVPQNVTNVLYPDGGLMRLSLGAPSDGAADGVVLYVNQSFDIVVSLFYVDPPPAGFTVT